MFDISKHEKKRRREARKPAKYEREGRREEGSGCKEKSSCLAEQKTETVHSWSQ